MEAIIWGLGFRVYIRVIQGYRGLYRGYVGDI